MNPIASTLAALRTIPDWYDLATCAQIGGADDLFFPLPGQSAKAAEAKAICDTCPARQPCLDDALATPREHDWGIRGGTTDTERRKMRREGAA